MEKTGVLNFKVGQVAEMRTFETGFRGAWFRCKIHDLMLKENKILLEYFDYDLEEISWVEIYQGPPFGRKTKHIKKQLMVRPQYPVLYHKNEMPPVISETCVIYGTWKVGNMVDWFKDDCFWSARIVKELSDDKVQIELPMPPSGEGKEGEEGKHEAFCKDLRPSLDWSETKGWTFATTEGQTPCDAQLIFPTEQGMDLEVQHDAAASSPVNASSTTRTSVEGDRERDNEKNVKLDLDVEHAVAKAAGSSVNAYSSARIPAEGDKNDKSVKADFEVDQHAVATTAGSPVNASSSTRIPTEGDRDRDRESEQNETNVKVNFDLLVESSESSSSLRVGKRKAEERRELNIMHEDTLEAAIIDLEELVNKVEWLQRLLHNDATTSSTWKFA